MKFKRSKNVQEQSRAVSDIEQRQNAVIRLQTELIMLQAQEVASLSSVIREVTPLLPRGAARTPEEAQAAQRCTDAIASAQSVAMRIQALSDQVQALRLDVASIKATASK